MNNIFKLKFNKRLGELVVVSELATNAVAKANTKTSNTLLTNFTSALSKFFNKSVLVTSLLTAGLTGMVSLNAQADTTVYGTHNQLGSVVVGTASSVTKDLVTTIYNDPNTIIQWQSFNINQNEILKFVQKSVDSAVLNRIIGNGRVSQILGSLQSNGSVFVINPNGIIFGKTSRVNVAGLVASTLDINNDDFLKDHYVFNKSKDTAIAKILNSGVIKANTDGSIALVGGQVVNSGVLEARNGTVFLLAGNTIEIADLHNPQVTYKVTAQNKAVNLGVIVGNQALVLGNKVLSGKDDNFFNSFADVVGANTDSASHASINAQGQVVLFGGSEADALQTTDQTNSQVLGTRNAIVENNGDINVSSAQGKAGTVKVLSDFVYTGNNSRILAKGVNSAQGGEVLLGGDTTGLGNIKLAKVNLASKNSLVDVSANATNAGHIVFWGDRANVNGQLKATSETAKGGFVETSGHQFGLGNNFDVKVGGATNNKYLKGTWLIDPDYFAVVGSKEDFDQHVNHQTIGKEVTFAGSSDAASEWDISSETFTDKISNSNRNDNNYITTDKLKAISFSSENSELSLEAKYGIVFYNVSGNINDKITNINLLLDRSVGSSSGYNYYSYGSSDNSQEYAIKNSNIDNDKLNIYFNKDPESGDKAVGALYVSNSQLNVRSFNTQSLKEFHIDNSHLTANTINLLQKENESSYGSLSSSDEFTVEIKNNSELHAKTDASSNDPTFNITSAKAQVNNSKIISDKDLSITTSKDNEHNLIINNSNITVQNDGLIQSKKGNLAITNANISSNGNLNLFGFKSVDITDNSNITASGEVGLNISTVDTNTYGFTYGSKNITIKDSHLNATNQLVLSTIKGDVKTEGSTLEVGYTHRNDDQKTADNNLNITSAKKVYLDSTNLTSWAGSISIAAKNDINSTDQHKIRVNLFASKDINLKSGNSRGLVLINLTATSGAALKTSTNYQTDTVYGNITVDNNLSDYVNLTNTIFNSTSGNLNIKTETITLDHSSLITKKDLFLNATARYTPYSYSSYGSGSDNLAIKAVNDTLIQSKAGSVTLNPQGKAPKSNRDIELNNVNITANQVVLLNASFKTLKLSNTNITSTDNEVKLLASNITLDHANITSKQKASLIVDDTCDFNDAYSAYHPICIYNGDTINVKHSHLNSTNEQVYIESKSEIGTIANKLDNTVYLENSTFTGKTGVEIRDNDKLTIIDTNLTATDTQDSKILLNVSRVNLENVTATSNGNLEIIGNKDHIKLITDSNKDKYQYPRDTNYDPTVYNFSDSINNSSLTADKNLSITLGNKASSKPGNLVINNTNFTSNNENIVINVNNNIDVQDTSNVLAYGNITIYSEAGAINTTNSIISTDDNYVNISATKKITLSGSDVKSYEAITISSKDAVLTDGGNIYSKSNSINVNVDRDITIKNDSNLTSYSNITINSQGTITTNSFIANSTAGSTKVLAQGTIKLDNANINSYNHTIIKTKELLDVDTSIIKSRGNDIDVNTDKNIIFNNSQVIGLNNVSIHAKDGFKSTVLTINSTGDEASLTSDKGLDLNQTNVYGFNNATVNAQDSIIADTIIVNSTEKSASLNTNGDIKLINTNNVIANENAIISAKGKVVANHTVVKSVTKEAKIYAVKDLNLNHSNVIGYTNATVESNTASITANNTLFKSESEAINITGSKTLTLDNGKFTGNTSGTKIILSSSTEDVHATKNTITSGKEVTIKAQHNVSLIGTNITTNNIRSAVKVTNKDTSGVITINNSNISVYENISLNSKGKVNIDHSKLTMRSVVALDNNGINLEAKLNATITNTVINSKDKVHVTSGDSITFKNNKVKAVKEINLLATNKSIFDDNDLISDKEANLSTSKGSGKLLFGHNKFNKNKPLYLKTLSNSIIIESNALSL